MLGRATSTIRSRALDERGFTLIELLVASLTGIVVTAALFTILDVSLHQTAQLTDKVQVDQLGRTAMTHILDELHSSCISSDFAPIQVGSEANKLIFVTAYSKEAVIPSAIKHEIVWTKEKSKETGTLIDYSYPSTSGSTSPNFTYSATASGSTQIASNIAHTTEKSETVPIFQYYEYAKTATGTLTTPLGAISTEALKTPLKSEESLKAASVRITFSQVPTDGNEALHRNVSLSDQITLSFSVPKAEDPIHDGPCQ
jgi:hypothetical protein